MIAEPITEHCSRCLGCIRGGVVADALNARLGSVDTAQLVAALGNQAVRLSPAAEAGAHRAEWTTRENLSRERWSVGFVDAGRGA